MTVVNGWTVLTPSSDSRLIYVSNTGNDTLAAAVYGRGYYLPSDPEIGSDPTNPVGPIVAYATTFEASKRFRGRNWNGTNFAGGIPNYGDSVPPNSNGYPDWLLFKRGETFTMPPVSVHGQANPVVLSPTEMAGNWVEWRSRFRYEAGEPSGRSESERAVIGAWGTPSADRPFVTPLSVNGMARNMAIVSIETDVLAWYGSPIGFTADNLLIEDVKARSLGSANVVTMQNAAIRRCTVTGSFSPTGHNQALFVGGINELTSSNEFTIEECVFDRNGYKDNPEQPRSWRGATTSAALTYISVTAAHPNPYPFALQTVELWDVASNTLEWTGTMPVTSGDPVGASASKPKTVFYSFPSPTPLVASDPERVSIASNKWFDASQQVNARYDFDVHGAFTNTGTKRIRILNTVTGQHQQFDIEIGTRPQQLRTYFDRNLYLSAYGDMKLRGNIISRDGGGSSVQMGRGGIADRNLFIWNEMALTTARGSSATVFDAIVKDNVILHDDHMLPTGGYGSGIQLMGVLDTTHVADSNIITHFNRGSNGVTSISARGKNVGDGVPQSKLSKAVIIDNAAYHQYGAPGITIEPTTHNGTGTGVGVLAALVAGNECATGGPLSAQGDPSKPATYTYSNNRFYSVAATPFRWAWHANGNNDWRIGPATTGTFAQWQAAGYDTDGTFTTDFASFKTAAGWTAPERDIVSYMQSVDPTYVVNEDVYVDEDAAGPKQDVRQKVWEVLVNTNSDPMTEAQAKKAARRYHAFVAFIQRAKANRKGAWDTRWTAEAVNNYIREGFGKAPITGEYDDRSLSVRLSEYIEQHGPVASLVLTTQPAGGVSGNPLSSQPIVTMRDASNLTVSSDNSTQVSVAIQSGTGGTLTGTTTVTVVNGVATFTDLVLSGDPLQSYVLRFSISSPSLFVDSNGVSVSSEVKTPVSVDIVTAPVAGFNDGLFTTQPVLVIKDVDGAVVSTNNTAAVTVAITGGSGGVLKGTLTKTASSGVVTFTDLRLLGNEGQTYTLSFDSTGLQGTTAQVTLVEYPVIISPVVSNLTAIRSDRYLGTVHSLDIMGEINKSELLSLRANKTKLVAVGHQDFIVNYRNTILRNRNTGYNIPEDWDLSWSIKFGPIATPNLIGPCFLWIKPEKFNVSTDGTKYNYLTDSSRISTFDNVFSAETDSTKALANYYGLNSFIPLNFDGVDDIYLDVEESGDFVIPTNIDFAFGFVIDTENVNTGNEGVVFSVGRENKDGSFQVIIDESSASRKIKIQTQAGDVKQSISTANNCYTQGESIAVVVSRVNDVFEMSVNGVPEALSGTVMYDVIASGTGSFIGGVEDAVDDTKKKYLKHNLYEVVLLKEIINKPITTTIVDQLEGYFAAKYGVVLPSGHAYKNNPFRASVILDVEPDVPTLPEVSCSTLSATSSQTSFGTAASTATVTVDVENESCQWSVSKTEDWITINNGAGIGDGSFTFDVSENTGSQRTATIAVTSGTASPVFISITQAASGISATGGTITDSGGYRYHTFAANGSFVVGASGSVEYLVVGGGGGGGFSGGNQGAGGGGAGSYVEGTATVAAGTYNVTVGAGGVGGYYSGMTYDATSGASSSLIGSGLSVTASGGGFGNTFGKATAATGGSGGGGGSPTAGGSAGTHTGDGTAYQNAGGDGIVPAIVSQRAGGGGGGAGSVGANAAAAVSGNGGAGKAWLNGTTYAGGGGGAGASGTAGSGGSGGGGNGTINGAGQDGAANTGGGGGAGHNYPGGDGGSGIVIIRYAI